MAFKIPTLLELVSRVRLAFRAELPGTDAFLYPNNINPTAKVIGGALSELFGRLDYVNRQARVSTAEGEWLEEHAAQYRMTRRPAAPASGVVLLTVTDATDVAPGGQFLRSDGLLYSVSSGASIAAAGVLQVPVIALTPGVVGLAQPQTPLTVVSGVSGAGALAALAAVDDSGLIGGLDLEADGAFYTTDTATLRGRIMFRLANPPHGGAPSDYVLWASSVPGVTRVYVERRYSGPGTVRVFPIFDDLFPETGGIAGPANIAAVTAAIEPLAPGGAAVVVSAPKPLAIDVEIFGLKPNTSAVQEAVLTELRDTIRRLGCVAGSDYAVTSMPYLATPQTFSASWIWQAVANASGEQRHVLRSPAADIVIPAGSIPVLGRVLFSFV